MPIRPIAHSRMKKRLAPTIDAKDAIALAKRAALDEAPPRLGAGSQADVLTERRGSLSRLDSVRLVLRVLIGTLVLGAGIGKVLDVRGFVAILTTYQMNLSDGGAWATGIGIMACELALGLWLLSGRRLMPAAVGSIALHFGYFVLMTISLLRGLSLKNCGCFGVFLGLPLTWVSPLEDLAMMALSVILYRVARKT